MTTGLRVLAKVLRISWLIGILGFISLIGLPHVLPSTGHQVFIVRGGSMGEAVPVGGIVVVQAVQPGAIGVGDVITFRGANGTVVTHRVIGVSDAGERTFATKGDESRSADPLNIPAAAVIGRVELVLPQVGYLMVALASPMGTMAAFGVLASLIVAAWFLDELVSSRRSVRPPRTVAQATN